MPNIPVGTTLNPSGSTRTLDATSSGLKALSFRPGGAWPATNPGQYPLGTPALNTMKQFIEGYASGAWGSPLPPGVAPNGSDPGVYYPQLSTLPNNYEAEVYFNADAMAYIGSPPVITLDGNGDVVITPRPQTAAEAAFVAKTAALVNVPQIGKTQFTSGAFCAYPYSSVGPFLAGARVKMPVPLAAGLWPAIWLLPASLQWPPEIDIIEYINYNGAIQLTTSLHDASLPNGSQTDVITGSINPQDGEAHDFWAQVYPDFITTFYDGKAVANFATPKDCASLYWYLIVDYGIAGPGNGWPGPVAPGTTKFPPMTVVDVIGCNMPATYGSGASLSYVPPNGNAPITFAGATPPPIGTVTMTQAQYNQLVSDLASGQGSIANAQAILASLT